MKTKTTTTKSRGAKCRFCKEYMLEADGCTQTLVEANDGRKAKPKPYDGTWEDDFDAQFGPGGVAIVPRDKPIESRCPDCGAKKGKAHHPGCDIERCAFCARQAISCEHMDGAKTHVLRRAK